MRLIDADVYCATICRCNRRACDRAKCPIHNAPTAYDIDKVVEELEELRDRYDDGIKNFAIRGIIEKAIEIVKRGGVSDDVCEWEKGKSHDSGMV